MRAFFRSLALIVRAARLIKEAPSLRRWVAAAAVLSLVIFIALLAVLVWQAAPITASMWAKPASPWLVPLWRLFTFVVFASLFVLGAATLPPLFLAPVADKLAEATERHLGAAPAPAGRFVRDNLRAVIKAGLRVALLAFGQVLLLGLWLVPGAGQALWSVLSLGWTIFWLAYEYVDITAHRHGLGFADVARLLRRRLGGALGLGTGLYVILWVPIVNVFFVPVAVVAGALFFIEETSQDAD